MKSGEKVTKDKKTVWENNEKRCSVDHRNLATANQIINLLTWITTLQILKLLTWIGTKIYASRFYKYDIESFCKYFDLPLLS